MRNMHMHNLIYDRCNPPSVQLTASRSESTLCAVAEGILEALHALNLALHITHIMAAGIIPPVAQGGAVLSVEVFGAAKVKIDSDVWAQVLDVSIE